MINRVIWALSFCILFSSAAYAKETLVIAGAGPSTKIVDLFFQSFAKQPAAQNYSFVVPPESVKHAGGIKHSFKNLFGRTGRPLNVAEINYKRNEIFLAMMPVSFATGGEVGVSLISMRELEMILRKEITNWKTVGGPDAEIITVGRESTEALFSELKHYYPFFKNAKFDIVLNKDHEVVDLLESPQGWYAISFGAKANLSHLNEIHLREELNTGVRLGLVYDRKHEQHPLVLAVKEYAQSDEWKRIVKNSGAYPVNWSDRTSP